MLIQQRSYIFENLQLGQKWSNYGFDMVITTTESTKKYILDYFPESLVFIIPPIISDIFKKSDKPQKPFIAISCRDRIKHKKIISEFYLKYPQLRWVNFKDMVQLTYEEFANSLKECMVSVWVDEDSTFGTFPLESMKCEVPVIGKIPNIEPDWLNENGIWTYDVEKITELLGTYVLANIDGAEITDEVKQKFKDTLLPYDENITKNSITSIFTTLRNKRIESINILIQNLTKEK
jgi:glycosyltransferase involved in cell wall biosynthesis